MVNVIGVRFKKAGKIYYFDPLDYKIKENDPVIVETARGIEFGQCIIEDKIIDKEEIISPLKPVIRIATSEDIKRHKINIDKESEALSLCEEKVLEHGLEMRLVDVEYTFDNSKVIFYFTADGRIDFRELVKDLASIFKTRIELRQIGVRDEAKMIGGVGICGRALCCSSWLGEFNSVSIKMAKEQNLSLNPSKISGVCGRLMCCLNYEQEVYESIKKKLPTYGSIINTKEGRGKVVSNSVMKESVNVMIFDQPEEVIYTFSMDEVELIKGEYETK